MLTKKFVKRNFTFKFYVKVWSCNRPFSSSFNFSYFFISIVCKIQLIEVRKRVVSSQMLLHCRYHKYLLQLVLDTLIICNYFYSFISCILATIKHAIRFKFCKTIVDIFIVKILENCWHLQHDTHLQTRIFIINFVLKV